MLRFAPASTQLLPAPINACALTYRNWVFEMMPGRATRAFDFGGARMSQICFIFLSPFQTTTRLTKRAPIGLITATENAQPARIRPARWWRKAFHHCFASKRRGPSVWQSQMKSSLVRVFFEGDVFFGWALGLVLDACIFHRPLLAQSLLATLKFGFNVRAIWS